MRQPRPGNTSMQLAALVALVALLAASSGCDRLKGQGSGASGDKDPPVPGDDRASPPGSHARRQ